MNVIGIGHVIVVAGLLAALPAFAKDNHGKGKGKRGESEGAGNQVDQAGKAERERGFSEEERQRIHGYVERYSAHGGKHPRELPPGLAKKAARGRKLPPAWEQKCVPGQILPVEVFEQCRPLPKELVVQLPTPPPATITVAIDGRVVRLLEATREILAVFNVHLPF